MPQAFENLDLSSLRPTEGLRLSDPVGQAGDIGHLSRALEHWINEAGYQFSCQGIDLSAEEMSAVDGLLPLVLHQARDCLARATGSAPRHAIVHEESETGLCGVAVSQVRAMGIGPWLLLASYALEERAQQHAMPGPIPMDGWYDRWQQALQNEDVLVLSPQVPSQPSVSVRG